MYEITYRFSYDELQTLPPEIAAVRANDKIQQRLVDVCADFKAALADSGMMLVTLADRTNQGKASCLKSMTGSFSMKTDRLVLFCDELFPGKTLDEIFFGENLPMPLPNIDRCFLKLYSYLYDQLPRIAETNVRYINNYIWGKTPATATVFSRYFGVRKDRGTDDPVRREYRNCAVIKNLTSFSMWRSEEANPNMRTLMRACFFADMSLDYLVAQDYSVCNLYYTENGKRVFIEKSDKKLLRMFCRLSHEDKADVLTEILKRLDSKKIY